MFTTIAARRHRVVPVLLVAVALTRAACGGDDDSVTSDTTAAEPETTEATPTTEAAPDTSEEGGEEAGSGATMSDMSADDQAAVEAAIAAGVERITAVAPDFVPPALYVGVWDPAMGSYLVAEGEAAAGQPATLDDHFRIGSTTKAFTATVVLELVDEGALALDDTIGALLPDLAASHPEIADVTVEQLLSMTSRIQDYLNVTDAGGTNSVVADIVADPTRVWAPDELVDAALAAGLLPEGAVQYSTTNFIILQLIAESIEGRPLAESIDERILEPLGMTESSLPIEDPSLPEPSAAGHLNAGCVGELVGDGATDVDTSTDPTDWTISYGQGGGGMTSTLTDLGLWADSNSGNAFLSEDLQAARLVADSEIQPGVPEIYGLGIFQLGDNWYGHSGEAIGWQSLVVHDPDTGVSLAFAANACNSLDLLFWAILHELYPSPPLDEFLTSQGA